MVYTELKKLELKKENYNTIKNNVKDTDESEILKYINYLVWKQYNNCTNSELKIILFLLTIPELKKVHKEHRNKIKFGKTEDFIVESDEKCLEEINENKHQIKIETVTYDIEAVLYDDFEQVLLVKNGEDFKKFGKIEYNNKNYIYNLLDDSIDVYNLILKSNIGTKINLKSHLDNKVEITKTYIKSELIDIDSDNIVFTKKSTQGVFSEKVDGSYFIIKSENIVSYVPVQTDIVTKQINYTKEEIAEIKPLEPIYQYWYGETKDGHIIDCGYGLIKNEFVLKTISDKLNIDDIFIINKNTNIKEKLNYKKCTKCNKHNPEYEKMCLYCGHEVLEPDVIMKDSKISKIYDVDYFGNFVIIPRFDIIKKWFEINKPVTMDDIIKNAVTKTSEEQKEEEK